MGMVWILSGMKIELKRLDIIWGRDYTHGVGKMEEITGIDESHRIFGTLHSLLDTFPRHSFIFRESL